MMMNKWGKADVILKLAFSTKFLRHKQKTGNDISFEHLYCGQGHRESRSRYKGNVMAQPQHFFSKTPSLRQQPPQVRRWAPRLERFPGQRTQKPPQHWRSKGWQQPCSTLGPPSPTAGADGAWLPSPQGPARHSRPHTAPGGTSRLAEWCGSENIGRSVRGCLFLHDNQTNTGAESLGECGGSSATR